MKYFRDINANALNSSSLLLCIFLGMQNPLQAQITADTTLPNNSLVTTSDNNNIIIIDGGTTAGTNLFHSFLNFSLPTNSEAFFNNSRAIKNIIGRVTGSNLSQIDGLIHAKGNSNLFLLNPNGFVFGPNATLNIGGSFLASTADSIQFADGSKFSTSPSQSSTLLTINFPVGLQFRQNSGEIRVLGSGHKLKIEDANFAILERNPNPIGLQIKPGNTLALISSDIRVEGGTLTALEGRIELGSVESGFVGISPTFPGWNVEYEDITSFKDIQFSKQALADVSGFGSGSIQVQGKNITLMGGSVLLSQNLGTQTGGSINVNASNVLKLVGTAPDQRIRSQINTQALDMGHGGDVFISASQFMIQNGARVDTVTVSSGNSGDIFVDASKLVHLSGNTPTPTEFRSFTSQIAARAQGAGKAGNIKVSTDQLTVLNGANIVSASNLGTGIGGDVELNVTDSIELIGVDSVSLFSSSVGIATVLGGDAGNLTINTARLFLQDGGRVDASTFSFGKAGSITINASEAVEIRGTVPNSINPSLIISSANKLDISAHTTP